MDNNKNLAINRLRDSIWDWLVVNEMEGDTRFYSIEEWKERGEPYHNDSDLVLISEGSLNFEINYGDPNIFIDLVESFGFWFELGHSWNMGFYSIENYSYEVPRGDYKTLLNDTRWKKKSLKVKERARIMCEDCKSPHNLEAHHSYYKWGNAIWEYPLDSFRCLCRNCHMARHKEEILTRSSLIKYSNEDLKKIRLSLSTATYWYSVEDATNMMAAFNLRENEFIEYMKEAIHKRKI